MCVYTYIYIYMYYFLSLPPTGTMQQTGNGSARIPLPNAILGIYGEALCWISRLQPHWGYKTERQPHWGYKAFRDSLACH